MESLGEQVTRVLRGMPVSCGLSHWQIATILDCPVHPVRNAVANLVHAGVVGPLPGRVRGRRWRMVPRIVDQALKP